MLIKLSESTAKAVRESLNGSDNLSIPHDAYEELITSLLSRELDEVQKEIEESIKWEDSEILHDVEWSIETLLNDWFKVC